ncbi:MAG TPA: LuxR C-terminal-related transcriptional regulator [Haliangiales bacterium]|nr:LuxR C-terminal-related transcriptional regulator [Haliangiales bacterium]
MKLRRVTEPRAFTQRELEVMGLMAKGKSNKEIAAELGVGFSAVHHHQYNIFRKLDVGNRTEATLKWIFTRNEAAVQGFRGL